MHWHAVRLRCLVVYGEWVNLAIVSDLHFYEQPYCTDSGILFYLLRSKVFTLDKSIC